MEGTAAGPRPAPRRSAGAAPDVTNWLPFVHTLKCTGVRFFGPFRPHAKILVVKSTMEGECTRQASNSKCAPMDTKVTDAQRNEWAQARANQKSTRDGNPVEGWPARIQAMKADGRLVERNGLWYRQE